MFRRSYKAHRFAAMIGLAVGLGAGSAGATSSHGLVLPEGSTEVGENRFRSGKDYKETLKYFNTVLKASLQKPIANQPGIKAVHYDSPDPSSGWEGINVYEKGSEVRIFVIPREGAEAEKQEKNSAKHKKKQDKKSQE